MNSEYLVFQEELKKKLSPSRYEHTIGVSYTAVALAMRYQADLSKAMLAGLMHDCAKFYKDDVIVSECEQRGVVLTEDEIATPAVIHAKLGAWMARHEYGIEDEAVLLAIQYHTTGRENMALLEKIVYIADYIEPGRKNIPNLTEIRQLAFIDLDQALAQILTQTVAYLTSQGSPIEGNTLRAWNYYTDHN